MSVVKLDLRICSQSPQQQYSQQQQQLSPSAPLVKINLSPESTRLSENGSCSSSLCSCCPTSSNNHSMQVGHLITHTGSASSISARISPQHTSTALSNKQQQQQQQQQHDDLLSISPTYPYSQAMQQQQHHHSMNIDDDVLSSIRNKLDKAPRKVSSITAGEQTMHTASQLTPVNTTNNNAHLENIVESLSKKLEKSSLENTELRETLIKEKSRSQMMLSENLSIKEELKKAQMRLKELESLQNMRSSQQSQAAIHSQRSSWVRSSPVKKPLGYIPPQKPSSGLRRPSASTHQQNNQKQLQLQQQQQQFDLSLNRNNNNNNNNLLHADEDIFRDQHEGCSLPDDCYCQQQLLEQNQSSLSILDILQNLNGKHDAGNEHNKDSNNFHEDHGNGSFSGTISKLKTQQNTNGLKTTMMTAATSQSGRRTNRTPLQQQQQGAHGGSSSMTTKKAFS